MDSIEILASALDWAARMGTAIAILVAVARWMQLKLRRRIVHNFFGGNIVTTYFPLRVMGGRNVIAEPDFLAAQKLSAFLAKFGITARFKFLQEGDHIDSTDPGIVAICGPKSSQMVKDALLRDAAVHFVTDTGDYCLQEQVDRKRIFKSPRDVTGELGDVGYLARNTIAINSEKTFISVAGIHAEGSACVISYITNYRNLRALYKRTTGSLFSAIISGKYLKHPLQVTATYLHVLHLRAVETPTGQDFAVIERPNSNNVENHLRSDDV